MMFHPIRVVLFTVLSLIPFLVFATVEDRAVKIQSPTIASWLFSGTVTNESGEHYGYFFQMKRQGKEFEVKTALIDAQTNQLAFYYEQSQIIEQTTESRWSVGNAFLRFNPINNSWIFGVRNPNASGFNFKVDVLNQTKPDPESSVLRPGVELIALQTSQLNGHIQIEGNAKEQFVTGNNAWFGKVWFSKKQHRSHDISTTFCRLNNDNGFYAANLKEPDASSAAVAGWRDALGNKLRMSQFLSIKPLDNNQSLLHLGFPKLDLKVANTLKPTSPLLAIAGFAKNNPKGFCFVTEQSLGQFGPKG